MSISVKSITFLLLCLCLMIACTQQPQQPVESPDLLNPTSAFISGEKPSPIKAKYIHPDSILPPVVVPLTGQPKMVDAHSNVHPAGTPKAVQIPKDLRVFTFGKDGVPLPKTVPPNGIIVPAKHPKPISAEDFRAKDAAIYDIRFLSDDQGLQSPYINLMLEDSRGHMWFGAGSTVIRYDAENFFRYTPKEGLLKFTNSLKSIMEDSKGNIWFGGWGGVCYYDGQNFVHFPSEEEYGEGKLKNAGAIMEDSKGNIWFYSRNLYQYDGRNFNIYEISRVHLRDKNEINTWYANNDISEIMEDSRGHLWLATLGSGVMRFDGKQLVQLTEKDGLVHNSISSIMEDSKGSIWFGSGGQGIRGKGVSRYMPDLSTNSVGGTLTNFSKEDGLSGDRIQEILEDAAGNIWFSTFDGGICQFDGKYFTHFTKEEGMSSSNMLGMMKDSQGTIWIGTYGGGVNKFKPNSFRHFSEKQGIGKFGVTAMLEDRHGNIWMGQTHGGMVKYDGRYFTNYTTENGLLRDHVNFLMEDKKGNIWIKYRDRNMSKFDGKTFTHYTLAQGLSNNPLNDIHEDSEGMIWIAVGWDRVIRLNPESHEVTHFLGSREQLIGGGLIFEDNQKNLWFGGHGYVTNHDRKNDQLNFVCQVDTTDFAWVDMMIDDKKGNVWLGTPGGTLAQVVKDSVEVKGVFPRISRGKELPNIGFNSATLDKDGNLWVGSGNSGLAVFIDGMEKIGQPDFRWLQYGKADGLKSKNVKFRGVLLDSKNQLWFSNGNANVAMLDLNNFRLPTKAPKNLGLSYIEMQQQYIDYGSLSDSTYRSALAFGEPLNRSFDSVLAFKNYPANLTLPYDLNHLTFHFSADDWGAPHQIRYSFKIDGIDQAWSPSSTEAKADYRNLVSGTHTFKVKAKGEAQVWSEPFAYTFTIRPPWWHTWWAYALYALLAVGAVGGYVMRLRQKIKEKQEQLQREQYLNGELRELNIVTSRFVPRDFVQILNKDNLKELQLGDQTKAIMTVLFADIRDYTSLSEKMTPEQNFKFINAYLGRMGPIIQEHGGFICQYYGDGIMALFKDNHDLAVKAAIEMQQALQRYNRKRFARNRQPIQVGIGLNTGQLMLGVIGDVQRYDTSVISDAVNTAARMEGLTKIFGCQVIVSEKTLMKLNISTETEGTDTLGGDYRFLGKVKVKGKERVLKIYDFYDGQTDDIRRLKSETKAHFEKALQFYFDQEFGKAADLLKGILEKYPGDIATKYYIDKSVKYIIDGVDEKWSGVEEMVSK